MASGLHVGDQKFEDILLNKLVLKIIIMKPSYLFLPKSDIFCRSCNGRFSKIVSQYKHQGEGGRLQAREDMRGFTRFFSELYLKLNENNENQNVEAYNVIGLGIEELIKYFCGTKTDENILFVSQILKVRSSKT
jgi:hypothetical protein